jgi:hypothetical protein
VRPENQVATSPTRAPAGADAAPGLSLRAYARRRGVSHEAVRRALASGRIGARPDGRIDPETADRQWGANTRPKVRRGLGGDPPLMSFAEARALREHYRAELARLEYEQRVAGLLDAEEVRAAAFTCARRARDLLLAIPDRVAPVVAGLTDVGECHRVLEAEVERASDELSQPIAPFAGRM